MQDWFATGQTLRLRRRSLTTSSFRPRLAEAQDAPRGLPRCRRSIPCGRAARGVTLRPEAQDRRVLARMVGAAEGRIVAVIGRDDADIVGAKPARKSPAGAHRRPRAPPHIRAHRADGRNPCRNRRGSRRRAHPPARLAKASSAALNIAMLPCGFTSVPVARCAKMSPILPTLTTGRPASCKRSSKVGRGAGVAKSLRLAVRVKPLCASPTKGRAMTRPIR